MHLNFSVDLTDKPRGCLRICHIVQGQVSADNFVSNGVHRKVQFPPDAALFLTVLFHFPFTFAEDFQAGGIYNEMGNLAARGVFERDTDGLSPSAVTNGAKVDHF